MKWDQQIERGDGARRVRGVKGVVNPVRPIAADVQRDIEEAFRRNAALDAQGTTVGSSSSALRRIERNASRVRCRRGQQLYAAGEKAEYWYRVVSGVLRKWALLSDGRRRILGFLLPGDFFGLSSAAVHRFTVEAVCSGTEVARYPRRQLEQPAESIPELRGQLLDPALKSIERLESRVLMLGQLSALHRVGSFLAELEERLPESRGIVELSMSRYDIADYLALSVETVSRVFTSLRLQGAIDLVDARTIRILDRAALEPPCLR